MTGIARSFKRPRFWIASGGAFMVAALYPIGLIMQCGWDDAQPWLIHDVAFTGFVLWIFPLIVGLLMTALLPCVWRDSSRRLRHAIIAIGALLVAAAIVVVVRDVVRRNPRTRAVLAPEPMHLKGDNALKKDAVLRAPLRDEYASMLERTRYMEEKDQLAALQQYETSRAARAAEYAREYPGFASISEAFRRGSITWYIKFLHNAVVAVTLALIFVTLVAAVVLRLRHPNQEFNADPLLLTYCLACLWFPMRLYTEWYLGLYSLSRLAFYPAFWTLFVLAMIGLVLLVIIIKPTRLAVTMPSIVAAIAGAFSAIAWFKPSMLWYVGVIVETLDIYFLLVLAIIAVTPLGAIALVTANAALGAERSE